MLSPFGLIRIMRSRLSGSLGADGSNQIGLRLYSLGSRHCHERGAFSDMVPRAHGDI